MKLYHRNDALSESYNNNDCLKHDKPEEAIVVAQANTVINPGTMVVEALNAVTTDTTVPTPARSNRLTVRTKLSAVDRK